MTKRKPTLRCKPPTHSENLWGIYRLNYTLDVEFHIAAESHEAAIGYVNTLNDIEDWGASYPDGDFSVDREDVNLDSSTIMIYEIEHAVCDSGKQVDPHKAIDLAMESYTMAVHGCRILPPEGPQQPEETWEQYRERLLAWETIIAERTFYPLLEGIDA